MEELVFPIEVNGYYLTSWYNAGKQLGYYYETLKNRYEKMKDTHSLEEIFVPKVEKETIFPLDVNGYHLTSWKNAEKQLGYDKVTIKSHYEKMKDTHTLEEIFVPKGESLFPLDINGYHFTSWSDASIQLGYYYDTLKNRYEKMKDTHTLEEIFVPKVEKETIFPLDVNGYHFTSWSDAARQLLYTYGSCIKSHYEKMKDTHTLEEIFVPKGESLFPLDINGYHFTSWRDAEIQLINKNTGRFNLRYNKGWTLMEVFGFSLHISDHILINEHLICQTKISDNLYKCKNKETCLFELHTYEELNEMWRKYHNVVIRKED